MRVAKSAYLRRLLKVQDVLISVWVYLLSVQAVAWIDMPALSWFPGNMEVRLSLVVFAGAVIALINQHCGVHEVKTSAVLTYAARFTGIMLVCLCLFNYTAHQDSFPWAVLGLFGVALFVTLVVNRLFLHWWYLRGRREHPENFLKAVVVGTGPRAQKFVKLYQESMGWQVDVVAMVELSEPEAKNCKPQHPDPDLSLIHI